MPEPKRPNMWKRFAHWISKSFYKEDFKKYEQALEDRKRHETIEKDKESAERVTKDLRKQVRAEEEYKKAHPYMQRAAKEQDKIHEYIRGVGNVNPYDVNRAAFMNQLGAIAVHNPHDRDPAREFLASMKKEDLDMLGANFKKGDSLRDMVNTALKEVKDGPKVDDLQNVMKKQRGLNGTNLFRMNQPGGKLF